MPNNNIISQEQKRRAISFRVAVARNDLLNVQKYCDVYTLNSQDAKGNTALHLVSEKGYDEILSFLLQQSKINFHLLNADNKKAVDLINQASTGILWQELLQLEKNLVQASVLRQKYLLNKNYDFILSSKKNANESFTLEDLSQINAYVKQTLIYGAPDWKPEKFPHQQATRASLWKKKEEDYYRCAALQYLFFTIEREFAEIPFDKFNRFLIIHIIHSALAEVMQMGRCYEQVAMVFDQLLIKGKKASLITVRAESSQWKPTENLKNINSNNFIILDKAGSVELETLESGFLIDPMDDKVASVTECAPQIMGNLMRIIAQPDRKQIQLFMERLKSDLPLKGKQHAMIAETLEMLSALLISYFELNWHLYWPEMKKNYPLIKEKRVKIWLEKLWECLAKKADIHAALADKLHLDEVQDSIDRLEQRLEIVNCAERLAHCLNKQTQTN